METMRLGRLGHASSVLIYGGAALGEVTEEDTDRSIELALEAGINHFDTAAGYGDSELHLGPYNHRLAREPEYLRDFDALAEETRARDVGLMLIKAGSRNLWRTGDVPRFTTWYEPLDVQAQIDAALAFALARTEVTGICTPGDVRLLPMFAQAEQRLGSTSLPDAEAELSNVSEFEPPSVRIPGREVPDWLEPLLPK